MSTALMADRAVLRPARQTPISDFLETALIAPTSRKGPSADSTAMMQAQRNVSQRSWSLRDPADGEGYRYKRMRDGKLWFLENFRSDTFGSSPVLKSDQAKTQRNLGRLFDWEAAQENAPVGWRLPSIDDWEGLRAAYDGSWAALNRDDFAVSPTHARYRGTQREENFFMYKDAISHFWTATARRKNSISQILQFVPPNRRSKLDDAKYMVMFGMTTRLPYSVYPWEFASVRYVRDEH